MNLLISIVCFYAYSYYQSLGEKIISEIFWYAGFLFACAFLYTLMQLWDKRSAKRYAKWLAKHEAEEKEKAEKLAIYRAQKEKNKQEYIEKYGEAAWKKSRIKYLPLENDDGKRQ